MTEGWAAIPNWLVRHRDVTPNMIAVYAVIQSHAGSKGTTRLLLQTIADEAGLSYSSAQRATKALNAMGVLWWEAQGAATKRTASIYHPLQEADLARVEEAHKPASKRKPVRSGSTVTGTVLTQVNPQDSAVPAEPVRSQESASTVTAVRSEGPYVRSQGPREEEPSKKNSLPSSYSSSPPPGLSIATGSWRPRWDPGAESIAKMRAVYGHRFNDLALMRIADDLYQWHQDDKSRPKPSDRMFETFVKNENDKQEKRERDERVAAQQESKPKNPYFE